MPSALETAIVQAIAADRELIRLLIEQETPFQDGVLPIAAGGTGATSASAALSALGGVAAGHTHAGTDIASGTVAPARLGSGASATTTLHGNSTFSLVDIVTETTGTLSIARGGTGSTSASAALSALGGASSSHTHTAGDTTSGAFAAARLGSGTPSATTLLWGDGAWAALAATDLPAHASRHNDGGADEIALNASQITAGTVATARLGSGTANSTTALFGDQTYKTTITGGGVAGQIVLYSASTVLTGDSSLTFNTSTNNLTLSSGGIGIGGAPSSQLTLSGATAQKSSGTLWDVTSDGRTKTVLGPYTDSLAFLRTLPQPIYYERNGALGTTKGERGMGFIAQDIETVAPHWVRYTDCEDNGTPTKLLRLDLHEMAFAELNAILELAGRVDQIEEKMKGLLSHG